MLAFWTLPLEYRARKILRMTSFYFFFLPASLSWSLCRYGSVQHQVLTTQRHPKAVTAEGELPPSSPHLSPASETCLEEQQAGSPGGKVLERSCKFCWGRAFRDGICHQQQQSWQVQFHWAQTGSSTLGLVAQHTKNKGLV